VVLTGLCSNPFVAFGGSVRGHPVRLAAEQIDAIVAAHNSGATVAELAAEFGAHRTTITGHLRRAAQPTQPRSVGFELVRSQEA
jgi:hypothetical protein